MSRPALIGRPTPEPVRSDGTGALGSRPRLSDAWVAVITVAMCIASEYKFRSRAVDLTVQGKIDPFIILELGVYAVIAVFLLCTMACPPRMRAAHRVQVTRWVYVGVLAASATYATYQHLAIARAGELLICAAFVQAVQQHATARHLHLMARAFVGLVCASVLVGLSHRFPSPPAQQGRFTWLYLHPISAANYCGLAAIFCAALWLGARRANRARRESRRAWTGAGYAVALAILVAALLSTHTRTAIAATAVALVVYALLTTRTFRKRIDLLIVVSLCGVVALAVAGPAILSYLTRGETASQLATLNERTPLWSEALVALSHNPLLGHGIGASHGLFLASAGLGGAHDAAINVLTDAGVVGALAWAAFLVVLLGAELRLLPKARGPMQAPLLLALYTFLVINSVTTEGLGAPANVQQLMLFLTSAWVILLSRRSADASPSRY